MINSASRVFSGELAINMLPAKKNVTGNIFTNFKNYIMRVVMMSSQD